MNERLEWGRVGVKIVQAKVLRVLPGKVCSLKRYARGAIAIGDTLPIKTSPTQFLATVVVRSSYAVIW